MYGVTPTVTFERQSPGISAPRGNSRPTAVVRGVRRGFGLRSPLRPEYLNSEFQEGEQKFGSFTAYEKQALGLDSKDVRDLKRDLLVG